MKMKRRRCVLIVVLLVACIIGILVYQLNKSTPGIIYTNDIKNYNTDRYRIPNTVFPDVIPSNVRVISFSYYNYWYEESDIYLELQFSAQEDMEVYLESIQNSCISNLQESTPPKNTGWIIDTENIYDTSYKEKFCTQYQASSGNECYTGYKILVDSSYICSFGLISYSFEELIVIHACTVGWFTADENNYVPMYFKRFNVPVGGSHKRIFNLEYGEKTRRQGTVCVNPNAGQGTVLCLDREQGDGYPARQGTVLCLDGDRGDGSIVSTDKS